MLTAGIDMAPYSTNEGFHCISTSAPWRWHRRKVTHHTRSSCPVHSPWTPPSASSAGPSVGLRRELPLVQDLGTHLLDGTYVTGTGFHLRSYARLCTGSELYPNDEKQTKCSLDRIKTQTHPIYFDNSSEKPVRDQGFPHQKSRQHHKPLGVCGFLYELEHKGSVTCGVTRAIISGHCFLLPLEER